MKLLVIPILILFCGTTSQAVTCGELEKRWYDHYIKDFKVVWDTSTFNCPGGESRAALAMYDLEVSSFTANSHGYTPNFYEYVRDNVKGVRHLEDCSAIARYTRDDGYLNLCPLYYKRTREDRVSTLVHEARHGDPEDTRHVQCVGGRFAGDAGACDDEFYNGAPSGSGYNMDVFFFSWVLKNSKYNELSESVIRSDLKDLIPDRFNKITGTEIRSWRGK